MKYEIVNDGGFKKGIIFLSGRGKDLNNWNITETGKYIGLEEFFRKRCATCRVSFDAADEVICNKYNNNGCIIEQLIGDETLLPLLSILDRKIKWYIVAHSAGSYFTTLFPAEIVQGILLVDPSFFNMTAFINFKVPLVVHLNIHPNDTQRITDWMPFTKHHNKSTIIVHTCGHMIHWEQPGKIQASIEQLLR